MLSLVVTLGYAQEQAPLLIAIATNNPPFVMQTAQGYYGFDIVMMNNICYILKRKCQFIKLPFSQVLTAVASQKANVAVSALTISLERAKLVNFSTPYLLSECLFIGPIQYKNTKINQDFLQKKQIGIKTGSIFYQELLALGVNADNITSYNTETELIDSLNKNSINLALMDNYAAKYWESESQGAFVTLGKTYPFGSLGIAVDPTDIKLLNDINRALSQFLQSQEYKNTYQTYLDFF